jgi:hypothetical protein
LTLYQIGLATEPKEKRLEVDLDGRGAALCLAVIDSLDVVAVRIQNESGVVPRMIGALSGCCAPQLLDHADAGASRYS